MDYKLLFKMLKANFGGFDKYLGTINLHLGCGNKPLKNFINVDYYNKTYADVITDLNKELPFINDSVDLIYSDNVFEHVENLVYLMKECHRILKPNGVLIVKVPYFKSKHAFVDPTHCNFFTVQSMDYYIKNSYFNEQYKFFDESFENLCVYLDPNNKSLLKKLVSIYAVYLPNRFENSILSNIFVFHNIVYVMRK